MGVVAGTAGHVDHGKSSLMRWLTGVDPDRLIEEKLRGITIELGYVFMPLPDDHVLAFIDVPGHEKFIRQMVAGVATVDYFLLVVAADEGVMQQTREHLEILRLLGVGKGMVALTKCDLVDSDLQDLAEAEVEELLASHGYGGSHVVRVSSVTGFGMENLRQALIGMSQEVERTVGDPRFRLSIDRVFTLQGHGSIVAGTVLSGSVDQGDSLELLPGEKVFRVREIRVNDGRTKGAGTVGDRVALNLVGLEREEAKRGSSLATPGWLEAADALDTEISMLPGFPLEVRQRVRFHCGTAEVMARAVPMEGVDIQPGASGFVHFQLEEPVVSFPGDRFVIRRFSPVTTIGGGVILESKTSKVRARNRDDRLKRVEMLAGGDIEGFLLERLASRPVQGIIVSEIAREVGRTAGELDEAAGRLIENGMALKLRDGSTEKLILRSAFRVASDSLLAFLGSYHAERPLSQGLPTGAVGRLFPEQQQWFTRGLLSSLMENGLVRRSGDRIARSDHPFEMPPDLQAAVDRWLSEVGAAGFNGYDCSSEDQGTTEAMLERGFAVELEKGLVSTRSMAENAWGALVREFGGREFRLGELREILGVPRRIAVLWAGVLDNLGFTVRHGELRTAKADG